MLCYIRHQCFISLDFSFVCYHGFSMHLSFWLGILNFKVWEILHCIFLIILEATLPKYTILVLKAKLLRYFFHRKVQGCWTHMLSQSINFIVYCIVKEGCRGHYCLRAYAKSFWSQVSSELLKSSLCHHMYLPFVILNKLFYRTRAESGGGLSHVEWEEIQWFYCHWITTSRAEKNRVE